MNEKRSLIHKLEALVKAGKKSDGPDLTAMEKILENPVYQDHLLDGANTKEAEAWIQDWLCRNMDSLLENNDLDAALHLMERSCWRNLTFHKKYALEKKVETCRIQEKIAALEKAVSTEGKEDFDLVDKVLSDPFYQNHVLGTPSAHAIESAIVNKLVTRLQQWFEPAKQDLDLRRLDRINSYMDRPAWQYLSSSEKQAFEKELFDFYKDTADDLERDGDKSSKFFTMRKIAEFRLSSDDVTEYLKKKLAACEERRSRAKAHITEQCRRIDAFCESGRFSEADHLLNKLNAEWPGHREIQKAREKLEPGKAAFDEKRIQANQNIEDGNFQSAIDRLTTLEASYDKGLPELLTIRENLVRALAADLLEQAGKCVDELQGCDYLEARLDQLKHSPLDLKTLNTYPEATKLFKARKNALHQKARDAVNRLDGQDLETIFHQMRRYENQGLITVDNGLQKAFTLLSKVQELDKDLYEKNKAVNQLCEIMGSFFRETGRLANLKNKVAEQEKQWNDWLDVRPKMTPSAVEAHVSDKLETIIRRDAGRFAEQARKKRLEWYRSLLEHLKDIDNCRQAIDYVKKVEALAPGTLDADREIHGMEIRLLLEDIRREWDEAVRGLGDMSGPLSSHLHRLDPQKISALNARMKKGLAARPGDNWLRDKQALLIKEIEARACHDRLKKKYDDLVATSTRFPKTGLLELAQQVEKSRSLEYPHYPLLSELHDAITRRVQSHLYQNLETLLAEKKYHTALTVASELHHLYGEKALPENWEEKQIRSITREAGTLAAHANKMLVKPSDYDASRQYARQALALCADEPVALAVIQKLSDREKGLEYLKIAEAELKNPEPDLDKALAQAEKAHLLNRKGLLDDLDEETFTFDRPETYVREIKKRSGIPPVFMLGLPGNISYQVMLKETIVFGGPYHPGADIPVSAAGIKQDHAVIRREQETYYLDPGNGQTCINGQAISTRHRLEKGQTIGLGRFTLEVRALNAGTLVLEEPESDVTLPGGTFTGHAS